MFALAAGKARTGKALGNPVLVTEGRVTLVDGILATAVLTGLALNAAAGWWWADPLAALVIVVYALREAREIFLGGSSQWLARFHALHSLPSAITAATRSSSGPARSCSAAMTT
jgi:divalent metal cation (Fe/Co/Zn/Cd) transporter